MNTSLANTLNESSISEMLISIQQVCLTLTDLEPVDVEMDPTAIQLPQHLIAKLKNVCIISDYYYIKCYVNIII